METVDLDAAKDAICLVLYDNTNAFVEDQMHDAYRALSDYPEDFPASDVKRAMYQRGKAVYQKRWDERGNRRHLAGDAARTEEGG